MEKIKINENWRVARGEKQNAFEIPELSYAVCLPYDAMTGEARDYTVTGGASNSYYGSCLCEFYRTLPMSVNRADDEQVYLEIEGLLGVADLFIGGRYISHLKGRTRKLIEITDFAKPNALVYLRIATHPDTGKYVGCGIAGGVALIKTKKDCLIVPYGVRIETKAFGEKAQVSTFVEVQNTRESACSGELSVEIFNEKGRRVAKKVRNVKLSAGLKKNIEIPIRIARPYEWTRDDPYMYTCKVSLGGSTAQEVSFGIVRHELVGKTYRLNGKPLKIKGAVLAHDNGTIGAASIAAAEYRKLSTLKEIGFHAVRYTGCPTTTALNTLDRLGMLCVIDLFDCLASGRYSGDGHDSFDAEWESIVEASMRTLRNHPCVAFYSVAADADESYGRGRGVALVQNIVNQIKGWNPAAIVTANAFERAPDTLEAEIYDIKLKAPFNEKQAVAAAREKDLFGKLTNDYFSVVDVAGYSHLYPRFSSDKTRAIIGLADAGDKAHDLFEEVDKHPHVVGGFLEYGADFLGSAQSENTSKLCINRNGILDITGRRKSSSYYKEILLGKRDVCAIVVQDPDAADPESGDDASETHALWNWPRHIGKPIKVVVYTGGDIVSLTLDGKSIGRKLAGKFNNYTAVFKTNFYPGKLEAISYYKGVEHARCTLETVSAQPKAIKLECARKNIEAGESTYVDITVVDKEGRIVPFASRAVEVSVSEEGELVAVGTANPYGERNPASGTCMVYDGHATALVRGKMNGKMIVKVTGEGLTSNKVTVKVK